jgi:hypothetical protein
MMSFKSSASVVLSVCLMAPAASWAAHPLITDDTGTQGKKKFQAEITNEWVRDQETGAGTTVKTAGWEAAVTLTAGVTESADLVVGIPYQSFTVKLDGMSVEEERGPGDASLDAKWRFHERNGLSLALKTGFSFPTGNEEKGLGTGKTGYRLFLIATNQAELLTLHANLGYTRNENNFDEERNLWHASTAAEYSIVEGVRAVADIALEKNADKTAERDIAVGLLGVIYSPAEDIDLDAGVRFGLNDYADDLALLAGVTVRF